jgi:hypothetical protein
MIRGYAKQEILIWGYASTKRLRTPALDDQIPNFWIPEPERCSKDLFCGFDSAYYVQKIQLVDLICDAFFKRFDSWIQLVNKKNRKRFDSSTNPTTLFIIKRVRPLRCKFEYKNNIIRLNIQNYSETNTRDLPESFLSVCNFD